jgi:hypothetical protein
MPSFMLKMDATPGRINQLFTSILAPGLFYGQCSEICGANHSFIPILIEATTFSLFKEFNFAKVARAFGLQILIWFTPCDCPDKLALLLVLGFTSDALLGWRDHRFLWCFTWVCRRRALLCGVGLSIWRKGAREFQLRGFCSFLWVLV